MKTTLYFYEATLLKIVDGDTITMSIDLGFKTYRTMNCRLVGINAEELKDSNEDKKKIALEAKKWLENNLKLNSIYLIKSKSVDKYGRPLIEIWNYNEKVDLKEQKSINQEILSSGLVSPYLTKNDVKL